MIALNKFDCVVLNAQCLSGMKEYCARQERKIKIYPNTDEISAKVAQR